LRSLATSRLAGSVNEARRSERRYAWAMAQFHVPDRLQPLVEQLRQLAPEERSLVVQAANEAEPESLPTVPWSEIEEAIGIVNIGGNAVEDCEAIYDDV
jgi:hypothetical protein